METTICTRSTTLRCEVTALSPFLRSTNIDRNNEYLLQSSIITPQHCLESSWRQQNLDENKKHKDLLIQYFGAVNHDVTATLIYFLETNKYQNLTRLNHPIVLVPCCPCGGAEPGQQVGYLLCRSSYVLWMFNSFSLSRYYNFYRGPPGLSTQP